MFRSSMIVASALALAVALGAASASAQINRSQFLNDRGNTKVQGALAKRWSNDRQNSSEGGTTTSDTVVNIGSKKAGTCNVGVGNVKLAPGQTAPKEVTTVVTGDVINVCR